ncbi:hypothetical protein CL673_06795 [Candidatus Bathyarchaeota archaeon]|nr:hypothetical protein [Candidatus Bathyarchaeota archaeon]
MVFHVSFFIVMGELDDFFMSKVDIPLIRHGKRQRIETLINEEALLLAKYLRDERKEWTPRIAALCGYMELPRLYNELTPLNTEKT